MATVKRNDVDYFPHPIAHGKKMFYLRSKYKNDGYAVWFILLEKLGKAENHYLDLSNEIQVLFLASECMIDEKTLVEIIELLVQFGEFDKQLWEQNKVLWNEKFVSNIQDAYRKRVNKCITKEGILTLLSSQPGGSMAEGYRQSGAENPQSKVKESRVNKSRVKEIKKDIILSFPFESEKFKNAWALLLTLKKWRIKPQTALQASLDDLGKYPEIEALEMMRKATASNWQGVFELNDAEKTKLHGTKDIGNNERRVREYGKPL